jgi:hypothetical protein
MKKIIIMFMILLSGLAYSRSVYLVIPKDAYSDLSYYAVNKSGEVEITENTDLLNSSYLGNDNLYLVTLETSSEGIFKLMAKYELNDKYYFLISSETDTSTIEESNFSNTYSPSDVYTKFNYSSYPGIEIGDDVRLSMIPVSNVFTEFSVVSSTNDSSSIAVDTGYWYKNKKKNSSGELNNVTLEGISGINPGNSEPFTILKKGESSENVYTSLKEMPSEIGYSYTDSDGYLHYKVTVTYVKFKTKNLSKLKLNGVDVEVASDFYATLEDGMTLDIYGKNSGNGQWYITFGEEEENTIVLLDDAAVSTESEIAIKSKVNGKSKTRETTLKTSLTESDNFIIQSIKE